MSIESGTQHLLSQDFLNVNKSLAKNESTKKIAMYFFIYIFLPKKILTRLCVWRHQVID